MDDVGQIPLDIMAKDNFEPRKRRGQLQVRGN